VVEANFLVVEQALDGRSLAGLLERPHWLWELCCEVL
jgi:hypothetical protein